MINCKPTFIWVGEPSLTELIVSIIYGLEPVLLMLFINNSHCEQIYHKSIAKNAVA